VRFQLRIPEVLPHIDPRTSICSLRGRLRCRGAKGFIRRAVMGVRHCSLVRGLGKEEEKLDRYKRALLEQRGELSVENTDAGDTIRANGGG
jgi:hypothetical protein